MQSCYEKVQAIKKNIPRAAESEHGRGRIDPGPYMLLPFKTACKQEQDSEQDGYAGKLLCKPFVVLTDCIKRFCKGGTADQQDDCAHRTSCQG